ncbi:6-carboxytetrahydropterin synthase [Saccharopolyspora sp. ID03-671]|uniref:6-pyruvoyl trahydropterin synthase family protein n=1 Tax=Saccharopolyspora sp. ID03-671 TaxID=3073066 RepID=UPI00324BCC87
MNYRIGKCFTFDAAHCLPSLPADHKCSRLHGHTYTVEIVLSAASLTPPGFVTDFGELRPLRQYLDTTMDHQHLNKVLDIEPTSENLARHIADWFRANVEPTIPARLETVRVHETPTSWAEYQAPKP